MPLVVLDARIDNVVKGLARSMPAILRATLREVGIWWHANLLQSHFTPGNEGRYGNMPRNTLYMQEIKKGAGVGPGRYVKNTLKGKSLRWMQAFPSVTATSHRCVVRMTTPTYFDKPFIGTFIDEETGRLKRVSHQPDKPAEATAVSSGDRERMTNVFKSGLEMRAQLKLRGI
jgi:hypothetical protein